jgi:hypothetical protein
MEAVDLGAGLSVAYERTLRAKICHAGAVIPATVPSMLAVFLNWRVNQIASITGWG